MQLPMLIRDDYHLFLTLYVHKTSNSHLVHPLRSGEYEIDSMIQDSLKLVARPLHDLTILLPSSKLLLVS